MSGEDILLESSTELSNDEKALFKYFGEGARIRPPYRILNPQRISIGDCVSVREEAYIHAYQDLSSLMKYIKEEHRGDFAAEDYRYDSEISIDREVHIGRNLFLSCTNSVTIERNVTVSERVFIGDNNHSFSHPEVPIMQQPNKVGTPVCIGQGSWIGCGASILVGTRLGKNSVVGTNSVVEGLFPDYGVIGPEKAKLLFVKNHS